MRYEELDLPIGGRTLHLRFNPRLTVLAGLAHTQRARLIEAIGGIHAGTYPHAHLSVVDTNGRPRVIDPSAASTGTPPTPGGWANALTVDADDLGLPRGTRDPARLATEQELDTSLGEADRLRTESRAAEATTRRNAQLRAELADCETRLADAGTSTDRHHQMRTRGLVELEQVRVQLAALDAPAAQQGRDALLLEATAEIGGLAAEWAEVADRLDHLRLELLDHAWFEPNEVDRLAAVPEHIPDHLVDTVTERDRLNAEQNALRAQLEAKLVAPQPEAPEDSQVLTLAVLDQDTLWMTHRSLLMATEALEAAQREERANTRIDPAVHQRLEDLHQVATETAATAERRWLPGVLIGTISVMIAALLLAADFSIAFVPIPLAVAVVSIVFALLGPRARARAARRAEHDALHAAGVEDITAYRVRLDDNPQSERWQRAERIIVDYQDAQADWQFLVGRITPEEATRLEAAVVQEVAKKDAARRQRTTNALRHSIDQAGTALSDLHRTLAPMLVPYGLDPHAENLATDLATQVDRGRLARSQRQLSDTEEAEAKLTAQLESELAGLGFEVGDLSARITAYGTELDAADRRDQLRRGAPERTELQARYAGLESQLSQPPPPTFSEAVEDPAITQLRRTRGALQTRVDGLTDPDLVALRRRLDRVEEHIATVRAMITADRGVSVARPIDHLVDTLVRYRVGSNDPGTEALPAILDDPFAATPTALKRQLLDALVVVSELVQVILLTDDETVITWAQAQTPHEHIDVIAPGRPSH